MAFGLKMGVILPGMDIIDKICESLARCHADGYLHNKDVVCVTESVVARAQNNYVSIDDVAAEITTALNLSSPSRVAVIFPIASRNRFSMILKGIARSAAGGSVILQLSFPEDEVGNRVIDPLFVEKISKMVITDEDLDGYTFSHPVTGVDYINYYRSIIQSEGAEAVIILSNNPVDVLTYNPDGVIAADIHQRHLTKRAVTEKFSNCITLDQVCTSGHAYSEWGLLGSNMSAGEKLKLAPRDCQEIVEGLQKRIKEKMGLLVEVLIYGDGAYLDPSSGIYELADPKAAFAATQGLDCFREGFKYKYLADICFYEKEMSVNDIEGAISDKKASELPGDSIEREGTTPRRMEDVLASLADLVSGSADAGTPVVIIRGFLS